MSRNKRTRKKSTAPERHYYRYISYNDGSGRAEGQIIKCFTDDEVERHRNYNGQIYERIN